MSNYEYNKKYSNEWNKNNTKTITIRLSNLQYEKLQEYCTGHEIARATLIKSRLSDIIE